MPPVRPVRPVSSRNPISTTRRIVAKPANNAVKQSALRKRAFQSKTAAKERSTRRVNTAAQLKKFTTKAKSATNSRVRFLTQKSKVRKAPVRQMKTRKAALSTKQKSERAAKMLSERTAKVKSAREGIAMKRKDALRTSVQVLKITRQLRVKAHATLLGHANTAKTIKSDSTFAELNIQGASSSRAIAEGSKPVSSAPQRAASQGSAGSTLTSRKDALDKLTQDAATLQSKLNNDTLLNAAAKAEGAAAERALGTMQRDLDQLSRATATLNGKLKPVSPDRLPAQQTKAANGQNARGDASVANVARAKAAADKDAAAAKQRAADEARAAETQNAKLNAKGEADAARAAATLRGDKEAARGRMNPPSTDPTTAKLARTDAEGKMADSQGGIKQAGGEHSAAVQRTKDTADNVVRNEPTVKDGEDAEFTARKDMNDADAQHAKDANSAETLRTQKDTLDTIDGMLRTDITSYKQAAQAVLPTSPLTRTSQLAYQDSIKQQIRASIAEYDAALKRLNDTLAERQRVKKANDGDEQANRDNQKLLAEAQKDNSAALADKAKATTDNGAYAGNEAAFAAKVGRQKKNVKKKANLQECLGQTRDILVKTEPPPPARRGPDSDTVRMDIHRAALLKELTLRLRSNQEGVKRTMNETEQQKAAAKAKMDEQVEAAARAKQKVSDEEKQAAAAKAAADAEAQRALNYEAEANKLRDSIDTEVKKLGRTRTYDDVEALRQQRKAEEHRRKAEAAEKAKQRAKEANDAAEQRRRAEAEAAEASRQKALRAKADQEALQRQKNEQVKAEVIRAAEEATANRKGLENPAKKPPSSDDYDAVVAKRRAAEAEADENAAALKRGETDEDAAKRALNDSEDAYDLAKYSEGDLVKERDTLQLKINELEAKIKKAQGDAESFFPRSSKERDALRKKVDDLKAELDSAILRKQQAEEALALRRAERDRLDALTKERDELRKEVKDLEAELKKNNKELDDIRRQIDDNNKKPRPDPDLDAKLKARQQELEARNRVINERLRKIRDRLEFIEREAERARLRKEMEDAMRKLRELQELKKKLNAESDDFDAKLKLRTDRLLRIAGIFASAFGMLLPAIIAELGGTVKGPPPPLPPPPPPPPPVGPGPETGESGAQEEPERAAESGAGAGDTPGNVQTCYTGICTIQNLLCKKGTSEYLRGCKDGTIAGTADGKHDGSKDEKVHRTRILPLDREELMKAVAIEMATFSKIQKEAYCIEIEKEGQAAGMTIEDLYTLYPECKLISGYGSYGTYGSYNPNNGPFTEAQAGGAEQSADYILGRTESYHAAYMRAYTNAWALSKLNAKVPREPQPRIPRTYGDSRGASGATTGVSTSVVVTTQYRTSEAEKILARLTAMDAARIDTSMFAALRSSLLVIVAAAKSDAEAAAKSGPSGSSQSGGAARAKKVSFRTKKRAGKTIQLLDLTLSAAGQ